MHGAGVPGPRAALERRRGAVGAARAVERVRRRGDAALRQRADEAERGARRVQLVQPLQLHQPEAKSHGTRPKSENAGPEVPH